MFAQTASEAHVKDGTRSHRAVWSDLRPFEWDLGAWIDWRAWTPARVWSSVSLMLASALVTVTLVFVLYLASASVTKASFFTGMVGAVFGLYLVTGLVLAVAAFVSWVVATRLAPAARSLHRRGLKGLLVGLGAYVAVCVGFSVFLALKLG